VHVAERARSFALVRELLQYADWEYAKQPVPYVGMVHSCLEGNSPSMESSFGRLRIAVNTKSARNEVRSTPIASTVGLLVPMMSMIGTRLSGAYKNNPFFVRGSRTPIRQPRVLSDAEREQVYHQNA